jgi:ABC-type tungstate transport system permease subunit
MPPATPWYREIDQGMGPTITMAVSTNTYLVCDRGA